MYVPPGRGRFVPRRLPIQKIPNLKLGLMDRQNPVEIPPIAMSDCENVGIDEGTIKSAFGWINMENGGGSEGPYYAIYQYKNTSGTQYILRMRQNILEYSSVKAGFNDVFTACTMPMTGSPATTFSFTDGEYPTFATLNDTVLVSNGTDSVLSSTDGITFTEQASLPKSKYILNGGKNRVLFAGQSDNPSKLSWSDINDPTTIAGFQLINPNDGQIIRGVGLTPWGSTLVFKDNTIYEISDVTFGTVDVGVVAENVSLANHNTIKTTEDSVIFMGFDGPYEYIGGRVRYLFGNIKKKGRNFVLKSKTYYAGYFNRKYHLSIPDSDVSQLYNAQEYIIDKNLPGPGPSQPYAITRNRRYVGCYGKEDEIGVFGPDLRTQSLYFGDSRISTGSPAAGGTNYGYLNSYELTASDGYTQGLNGEAQECYFTTKYFTNDEFYFEKKYKKFYFVAKADQDITFTISYRFDPFEPYQDFTESITTSVLQWDFEDGSTGNWTFDDATTGGWQISSIKHVFVDIENNAETPRGIQFKIKWSSVNPVEIIDLGFRFMSKSKFK